MEYWAELGFLGLFLASIISATVIPFSSEAVFVVMITNQFDPMICLVVATAGNTIGGMTSYGLGRLGNWDWLQKFFGIKRVKVERFQHRIEKSGSYSALLCWAPIIGDLIAVGLGFLRLNWPKVLLFMMIGKLARYGVLMMLF